MTPRRLKGITKQIEGFDDEQINTLMACVSRIKKGPGSFTEKQPVDTGWFWARPVSKYPKMMILGAEEIVCVQRNDKDGLQVLAARSNGIPEPLSAYHWGMKISQLHTQETRIQED